MENKHNICALLFKTLQATKNAFDLITFRYDEKTEIVTAKFIGGGTRKINVSMDSGTAMIRDIVNNLGC